MLGVGFGIVIPQLSPNYATAVLLLPAILLLRQHKLVLLVLYLFGLILGIYRLNYINASEDFSKQATYLSRVVTDGELKNFTQEIVVDIPGSNHLALLQVDKYPPLLAGNTVEFTALLEKVAAKDLPEYYKTSLKSRNIAYTARPVELKELESVSWQIHFARLRQGISNLTKQGLGEPAHKLLDGLLIGRDLFNEQERQLLQASGLAHLVAVSGYNVGLVLLLAMVFVGHINRRTLSILGLFLVLSYLFLVGEENISLLRAVLMAIYLLVGIILGRKVSVWLAILFSSVVMLWLNPFVFLSLSFQLSFAAVLGILVIYPRLNWIKPKLPKLVVESFKLTIATNIATAPITFLSFGGYSVIGLLANLVVGPLIPVATMAGFLALPIELFVSDLGILKFLQLGLTVIWQLVKILGQVDFGYTTSMLPILLLILILTLAYLTHGKKNQNC